MTPIEFAQGLAKGDRKSKVLAIAIVARGLSDDDPSTFRQGWPLSASVQAAARYLGLSGIDPDEDALLQLDAAALAPTLSDAMLNKGAASRG